MSKKLDPDLAFEGDPMEDGLDDLWPDPDDEEAPPPFTIEDLQYVFTCYVCEVILAANDMKKIIGSINEHAKCGEGAEPDNELVKS